MAGHPRRLIPIDHHGAAAVRADLAGVLLAQQAATAPKYFADAPDPGAFAAGSWKHRA